MKTKKNLIQLFLDLCPFSWWLKIINPCCQPWSLLLLLISLFSLSSSLSEWWEKSSTELNINKWQNIHFQCAWVFLMVFYFAHSHFVSVSQRKRQSIDSLYCFVPTVWVRAPRATTSSSLFLMLFWNVCVRVFFFIQFECWMRSVARFIWFSLVLRLFLDFHITHIHKFVHHFLYRSPNHAVRLSKYNFSFFFPFIYSPERSDGTNNVKIYAWISAATMMTASIAPHCFWLVADIVNCCLYEWMVIFFSRPTSRYSKISI